MNKSAKKLRNFLDQRNVGFTKMVKGLEQL